MSDVIFDSINKLILNGGTLDAEGVEMTINVKDADPPALITLKFDKATITCNEPAKAKK